MQYYSSIMIVTGLMLGVMIVHLHQTKTSSPEMRHGFLHLLGIAVTAAFFEWASVAMSEFPGVHPQLHAVVKCAEFITTPFMLVAWIKIISPTKSMKWLYIVACANATLEFSSIFTGAIFSFTVENVYVRGPLYGLYVGAYLLCCADLIGETVKEGRRYQDRNLGTLVMLIFFLIIGIGLQLLNSQIRTCWVTVAASILLYYVYYIDIVLQTDELTGLLNRRSFEYDMARIDYPTVILILDIDHFKQVNDLNGHAHGDMVLKQAAIGLLQAYQSRGFCYRIGGDEFSVILRKNAAAELDGHMPDQQDALLEKALSERCHECGFTFSLSCGMAHSTEKPTLAEVFELADRRLYENKKNNLSKHE